MLENIRGSHERNSEFENTQERLLVEQLLERGRDTRVGIRLGSMFAQVRRSSKWHAMFGERLHGTIDFGRRGQDHSSMVLSRLLKLDN